MSQTITDPVTDPVIPAGGAATPIAATPETPVVAEPTADEAAAAAAAAELAAAPAKPDKTERRIANLTRKMGDESRLREAAERRAEAAEALLAAGKPAGEVTPPAPRPTAPTDLEARARELVEERAFNSRLTEIDAAGKKELGADAWEAAKTTLTGLGAVNNAAFLRALAEAENPAKLFAHFADDTDALMELLAKSPAALGAKIGRLDAAMSVPTAKPLSKAPIPAVRVAGAGGDTPANIYDPRMSMADFNKEMDKILPAHLGGKRKAA